MSNLSSMGNTHKRAKHSAGEYLRDMAHMNCMEGFWGLLTLGCSGITHYMSEKHLPRSVKEVLFRHSAAVPFTSMTLARMAEKRLTNRDLVQARREEDY